MLILKIHNGTSTLEGLSREQLSDIRKIMFYEKPGSYFTSKFHDQKIYLIDKKGEFPTGLLDLCKAWLEEQGEPYERLDYRRVPKASGRLFNISKPITPYHYQTKLMEVILKRNRGTVSAITGSGKSIMMAMLINQLQLKTLVVVPNLILKKQLSEVFSNFFGSFRRDHLMIEHVGSPNLNNAKNYDVLIVDEAHHSAAATYRDLNKSAWQNMYYRYFFTGTPIRAREEEQIVLEGIAGTIIHEVTYEDALKAGTIVPVEAFYVNIPKSYNHSLYSQYAKFYDRFVVNNDIRNDIIKYFVDTLKESNTSTLVLVREIAHGEILSQMTGLHFVKGDNEDNASALALFNEGGRQMIGTVGVLGEGADTKPTEWVIIAGLGKSKPAILQMVGRGLRSFPGKTSCKVLLFKDSSHKFSSSHFREQCKTLLEYYGIRPVELIVEVENVD